MRTFGLIVATLAIGCVCIALAMFAALKTLPSDLSMQPPPVLAPSEPLVLDGGISLFPSDPNSDTAPSPEIEVLVKVPREMARPVILVPADLPSNDEKPNTRTNVTNARIDVGEASIVSPSKESEVVVDMFPDKYDRITSEILARIGKGKVLVVWCVDRTESMLDDRQGILDRLDRIYQELGASEAGRGDAVSSSVVSFADEARLHTPQPMTEAAQIKAAVEAIPTDPREIERPCEAVRFAIAQHAKLAKDRKLLVFLVTDESGEPASNSSYLEAAAAEAKAARAAIYVMSHEAAFGLSNIPMHKPKAAAPDDVIVLDRGPETPFPERLQFDGFRRPQHTLSSGFGPYELTRLCKVTGGVFYLFPKPEAALVDFDNHRYALDPMRHYLPDLSARAEYAAARDARPFRSTIWKVICDLNPDNNAMPELRLERFSLDRNDFARQAGEELQKARQVMDRLAEAQRTLEQVQPFRARESERRWQASYDLTLAQLVAFQVRLKEYQACLADFMVNPKPVKNLFGPRMPTDCWCVALCNKMLMADETQVAREQAATMFQQVIDEHGGTPFADQAAWELNRPYGVELVEKFLNLPRRAIVF